MIATVFIFIQLGYMWTKGIGNKGFLSWHLLCIMNVLCLSSGSWVFITIIFLTEPPRHYYHYFSSQGDGLCEHEAVLHPEHILFGRKQDIMH